MTGRIVYTPTQLHDCEPPSTSVWWPVGTQWQCDDCWQIWYLGAMGVGPFEKRAWRRGRNPHCAVVANGDGELVEAPDPGSCLAENDAWPARRDDFDAKRVTLVLIAIVIAAVLLTVVALWLDGRLP